MSNFLTTLIAKVSPNEEKFFTWFDQHAALVVEAAKHLAAMSAEPAASFKGHFEAIETLERKADDVSRDILLALHRTFVTPFDRGEIKDLATALDDVVDIIEQIPVKASIYGVQNFTPEMAALGQIVLRACEKLQDAVSKLNDMTHADGIIKACHDVKIIEDDADRVRRNGIARLFAEESDARALLATKELYELYEAAVDRCEDAADMIHSIVLERI
ncbi:DUF47 domain-containing protein [Leeia oryzae]|uniref:DUF47 domain-containing protein n=1 Tax=Leeia oryzae TaxID=356662 RepID=UPI000376574E|nr:DUF47 family protein [Leeia oryzae]